MAAELDVEGHRGLRTALREDVLAERVGNLAVEDALLLEEREGIGLEHLGPLVAVVSGRIAAGEDVAEGGRHGRTGNDGQHLRGGHRLHLELLYITLVGLLERMPCHVGHAERELAHVGVGRQVVLRRHDALDQLGGHRLARLIVDGPQVEELLLGGPVLHNLRRELDEVAVDVRAGERLVGTLAQHAVQRVAELVEEGLHLVKGQQRGLRLGGLREVHHQRHQRAGLFAVDHLRTAVLGHPGARVLRGAGEEVEVEHRQEVALLVGHVVGRHVGVVDLDLLVGRKVEPVELVGQQEDTLLHVLELEVGLHHLVAQGILLVLVLLAVVGPVPRHQLTLEPLRGGIGVQCGVVLVGVGLRGLQQLVEEGVDRLRIPGHALLEHVVGIGLVAEQVGDFQTQVGNLLQHLAVVELTAERTRIVGAPELLLQLAVRRVGEEGDVARRMERHGPPLLTAGLGLGGQPLADKLGKFGNGLRVGDVELEGVGGGQLVLVELERQAGQLGRILAVELLVGIGERRAVAGEALVALLEQHLVLLREEPSRMLVDGLHAGEELGVERDVVLERRQTGLHLGGDALHLLRSVGAQQVVEDTRDAVEQRALTLERHDRILEGGFGGVVHNRLDFGPRAGDGGIEGRFIVFELDFREGRRGVGGIPLDQQRIGLVELGQLCLGERIVGAARRHCGDCHD